MNKLILAPLAALLVACTSTPVLPSPPVRTSSTTEAPCYSCYPRFQNPDFIVTPEGLVPVRRQGGPR